MNASLFRGTGVALITPFTADYAIDYDSLGRFLAFQTNHQIDYFVVQGTTGESATTTEEEKQEILDFVKENNPQNKPIVHGIGGNNTFAVIKQIKHTDLSGVEAVLSVSPYYNKPSQAGIINHYKMIADACPIPIIIYNVPGRTGSNILAQTTLELAKHPNIIGVKEASGDLEQCKEIAANKAEEFMLISGDDMMTEEIIQLGGLGVISVMANAFPQLFKKITDGAFIGDRTNYEDVLFALSALNPLIYEESSATGIKQVLHEMGLCETTVRPPLCEASEKLVGKIRKALDELLVYK